MYTPFRIVVIENILYGQTKSSHTPIRRSVVTKNLYTEKQVFNKEGSLNLACNEKHTFFTSEQSKRYNLWYFQKVCDALHYLLDNLLKRFGILGQVWYLIVSIPDLCNLITLKLYRQILGIPMGTNCAPLVANLFFVCYERDFAIKLMLLKHLTLPQDN